MAALEAAGRFRGPNQTRRGRGGVLW